MKVSDTLLKKLQAARDLRKSGTALGLPDVVGKAKVLIKDLWKEVHTEIGAPKVKGKLLAVELDGEYAGEIRKKGQFQAARTAAAV